MADVENLKEELTENLIKLSDQKRILKDAKKELKENCMANPTYQRLHEESTALKLQMKEIMVEEANASGLQATIVEAKAESDILQDVINQIAIQLMTEGGMDANSDLEARGFTFTPKVKVTFKTQQMKLSL